MTLYTVAHPCLEWIYLHLPVAMGITALGASILNVVEHAGEPLPGEVRWLLVGAIAAALTGNVRTARTMDWVAAIAGVWLILATSLLRGLTITAGLWNDIIVGVIVLILSVWAALAPPRAGG